MILPKLPGNQTLSDQKTNSMKQVFHIVAVVVVVPSRREIRRRCVLNYFELCISKFRFALPTKFIIRGAAALRGTANDGKVFMLLPLVMQVLGRCCCCRCCSDSSEFMQQGAVAAKRGASSVSHLASCSCSWRCHDVISFCGRHII